MVVPPVIIHFKRWDFPLTIQLSGYPHDYGNSPNDLIPDLGGIIPKWVRSIMGSQQSLQVLILIESEESCPVGIKHYD